MSKSKVIDIDRGWGELKRTLKTLKERGSYVKVGVLGAPATEQHDDLTNVEIAIISEFGSATQPARPFIGGTFDVNRAKYEELLAKGLGKLYENKMSVKQVLGLLGVKMSSDIKQRVMGRDNNLAPNAPSTMAKKMRKGEKSRGDMIGPLESPKPLFDTGRMVGSVTHEVVLTSDEQGKGYSKPTVSESETPSGGHEE